MLGLSACDKLNRPVNRGANVLVFGGVQLACVAVIKAVAEGVHVLVKLRHIVGNKLVKVLYKAVKVALCQLGVGL